MRGNIFWVLLGLLLIVILASPVYAGNYTETISYLEDSAIGVTYASSFGTGTGGPVLNILEIYHIENYKHISMFQLQEEGTDVVYVSSYTSSPFIAKIGTQVIGSGLCVFSSSTDGKHDRLTYYFENWDIGSITGNKEVVMTLTNNVGLFKGGNIGPEDPNILGPKLCFSTGSTKRCPVGAVHVTSFYALYSGILNVNQTGYMANGTFTLTSLSWNRQVDGENSASSIDVRSDDGENIYLNDVYATSGITSTYIDRYPSTITISLGEDAYITYRYLTGDNPEYDIIEVGGTPTVTITPTPVPELCGYWSLAVNTSNILMNEYVKGTLTETDTSDRYDMIDWYRVLPSGQEILALHYVYDPGLFGMGAGWFEVTPTGTAYASSAAEAMENDIQFTTAGANHLRAKIYDDKSILPMVYHDYDLGCTLDQVVYVGETTQASNTLGINVKECDTNAMLTGVNIGVYDYLTGQWSNKTSEYGGTTYFNVVPGHNVRVVANKTGWLNSDTDYTIPATPYLYEVCLKRPLVDIEDKSYVFFNVRDSVTLAGLFQANIQLSDGQIQNTLPSGYAGFSVNDSETYIYTVTKPGYQSFSDSFTITTDTTIPVKLVQISPTPTLTYPITTLPTVTITGTTTGTVTPTGTGVWSNTTATLSPTDKTYKTTKGLDIWYMNLETLSGLLFVAAVFGAIGLISDSMGRRRRR